jgi:RNA polymerase sigma-70 factor (ECF subfamily)
VPSLAPRYVGAEHSGNVQVLPWAGDDRELLAMLQRGGPAAAALLYDRFADDVHRTVARCLGPDRDRDDVIHDAFVQILRGLARVREPAALRGRVVAVAVNTARSELRRRRFRRLFWSPLPAPDREVDAHDPEARDLLRRVYQRLDRLGTTERLAFVLRFVERFELTEVARLMDCSLATAKRKIARAQARFAELAADDPELLARFRKGDA